MRRASPSMRSAAARAARALAIMRTCSPALARPAGQDRVKPGHHRAGPYRRGGGAAGPNWVCRSSAQRVPPLPGRVTDVRHRPDVDVCEWPDIRCSCAGMPMAPPTSAKDCTPRRRLIVNVGREPDAERLWCMRCRRPAERCVTSVPAIDHSRRSRLDLAQRRHLRTNAGDSPLRRGGARSSSEIWRHSADRATG